MRSSMKDLPDRRLRQIIANAPVVIDNDPVEADRLRREIHQEMNRQARQ
jgi:hypothetical protein